MTEPLFITDDELVKMLGVPEKDARMAIRELEAKVSGFPRKQKLWGDRRYWPAVKLYFDKANGIVPSAARLATENRDRTLLPRNPSTVVPIRRNPNGRKASD